MACEDCLTILEIQGGIVESLVLGNGSSSQMISPGLRGNMHVWSYLHWGHTVVDLDARDLLFALSTARHRFSAFWLRSKCSICSYQLNIWYGVKCPFDINLIFDRGWSCRSLLRLRRGLARSCSTARISPLPHYSMELTDDTVTTSSLMGTLRCKRNSVLGKVGILERGATLWRLVSGLIFVRLTIHSG